MKALIFILGLILIIALPSLNTPTLEAWRLLSFIAFAVVGISLSRWQREA